MSNDIMSRTGSLLMLPLLFVGTARAEEGYFTRTRTESRKSFPAAWTQLLPDSDDQLPQPSRPDESVAIEHVRKFSGKNFED